MTAERLEKPAKNWKFSADDTKERERWKRVDGAVRARYFLEARQ